MKKVTKLENKYYTKKEYKICKNGLNIRPDNDFIIFMYTDRNGYVRFGSAFIFTEKGSSKLKGSYKSVPPRIQKLFKFYFDNIAEK